MIEIRFKSDQDVRPLLRSTIALRSLRGNECLIRIFREGSRVQGKRRARHDELRERLFCAVRKSEQMPSQRKVWHTFNSFELVSIHSFMHVSRKST